MGGGDYTEADFTGQQIIWGEGYMSPGGAAEVAALVAGLDIEGRDVLDIGCGLGGPSVDLVANHGAGRVTGAYRRVPCPSPTAPSTSCSAWAR